MHVDIMWVCHNTDSIAIDLWMDQLHIFHKHRPMQASTQMEASGNLTFH